MNKWETVRLGDVCTKDSSNIAQKDIENNNGSYGIYGASGYIKDVNFYHQDKPYIAVIKDGAGIGRTMLLPEKTSVIGTMQYLIPNNSIYVKYLYYAITHMNLAKYFTGATIPHIYFKDYQKEQLSLPPLEIQKQIAENLDKVTRTIELCNAILKKLDLLVKARFVEMFGDIIHCPKYKMIKLTDISEVGSSKRIYANEYVEAGIPFYRSKEIRELGNGLKPSVELFISKEKYELIKAKYGIPKVGDILIAAIGATIGYTWIVDTEEPFYYKDGNLIILYIRDNINPIYLNHAVRIIINEFKNTSAFGSAQLALTIEKIQKIKISYPNLILQNQFADFVTQTGKTKSKVKQTLEKAETLKKALMQKYFG